MIVLSEALFTFGCIHVFFCEASGKGMYLFVKLTFASDVSICEALEERCISDFLQVRL